MALINTTARMDNQETYTISMQGPLIKSNGELDSPGVEKHILQLEETVSVLQKELKTQVQTQAAVLSSVLSKLASTTDEVANLKADFNDLENNYTSSLMELSSVKHQLSTLVIEFSKMNREFQHLRKNYDLITVELDSIKREQNTTETIVTSNMDMLGKFQENLTSVVSEIEFTHSGQNDLEKRIKTLERGMQGVHETTDNLVANISHLLQDVAFQATRSVNDIFNDSQVIQFPNVVYNRGDGYVNTNGTFIALMSGTYILFTRIMIADTSTIWVYMRKEKSIMGVGHVSPGNTSSVVFIFAVGYLHQGNQVWLTKERGGPEIFGNYHSYFGGALLAPH